MQICLLICLIVFLIILVLLERLSSIKILIRLFLTLAIIYGYIIAISSGKSMVVFSTLVVFALTFFNVFIKSGIHKKSFSEFCSVVITTIMTSGVIWVICKNMNLKIFQDEIMRFNGIKKSENAMFGISMIVSLGIFMDIVSRIIFQLDEEKDKTTDIPWKKQFEQGIQIGRNLISEKINIIVLIWLGVSLFPICANINNNRSFSEIQPEIFGYVLIAIVINIGLVLSVPITSCLYACFNRKKIIYKTVSENKINGKRSLKL